MQNHPDCGWDESASWYKEEVLKTLEEIRSANAMVEVNTRGMYKKISVEPYPSVWILKEIHAMGIPVCLNSDAHHPREITGSFEEAAVILKKIGFKTLRVLWNKEWQDMAFNEKGVYI